MFKSIGRRLFIGFALIYAVTLLAGGTEFVTRRAVMGQYQYMEQVITPLNETLSEIASLTTDFDLRRRAEAGQVEQLRAIHAQLQSKYLVAAQMASHDPQTLQLVRTATRQTMGLFAERLSSPGSLQPGDRPSPDQRLTEIRQTHDQLRRHLQLRRQQLVNQIAVASQEADRFLLIVLASAMLLIAVLSVRIPQVIDRRVRALVHATKELEAGHYRPGSRDYPEDEFGNLAQAFDRMALALEEKKEQLQQSYKALEGVNKNLEAMVQERTGQLRAAQDELIKREKLAMLGTLAGAIGHELRNPLSVMATSVYFLEKVIANADGKIKKHLDMLTHQISAANRIITNLLDFARSKEPTREEADMNTMVQEVIQRSAIPKTVHLHVNLGSGPSKVWLDPSQVNQVILNLVSNAVQSMPRGGQLGVEVNRVNGSVELRVADSGCGISEEDQRRIFQPLFTTKQKGIGLGLAVSRKIVEANGGQIGFDSVPGQGTTFKLRFPVFEPAADTRAASMS